MSDLSDPTTWEPKTDSIYEQGKHAHLRGVPMDQSPYQFWIVGANQWKAGWMQAEHQKSKATKDQAQMDSSTPIEPAKRQEGGTPTVDKRYGKFVDHAQITQDLKSTVRAFLAVQGKRLADDQQEAIDMIFHKVGRIVSGDPTYVDSWVDISGYATLIVKRLQGESL